MVRQEKDSVEVWFRINSKDSSKNIIRVLSPHPFSPFPIPFDQLLKHVNEKEGTIEFRIATMGNLFDEKLGRVWVFDMPVGLSRFLLIREGYFNLLFYHFSPKLGIRIASLDVDKLSKAKGLYVAVTWSETESCLYVGDIERKVGLLSARAESQPFRAISGKDGSFLLVGDEGLDVGIVYVKKGERVAVEPNAIEIFNFSIERVNTLIDGCSKGNFLFETTCVQAGLVMLVSAFETYCRKRFLEMELEGWFLDFDLLCAEIISCRYLDSYKHEIEERSNTERKRKLELLIEDRRINFQDFDGCKEAFNKGYGVKFGEIPGITSQMIERIRELIEFRHKIVHSGRDATILNFEEFPDEKPIFSNKQSLEDAKNVLVEFIQKLHVATFK